MRGYNAKHPERGYPDDPKQLTDEQKTQLYREEFYDRPRIGELAKIPGLAEAAPQLAEQMFDSGVLHGSTRAGQWLQQSLDEKLGTDLRTQSPNGAKRYDGILGPRTRAAVARAVREGKVEAVSNSIVNERIKFMRSLPDFPDNPGWIPRAESFRR